MPKIILDHLLAERKTHSTVYIIYDFYLFCFVIISFILFAFISNGDHSAHQDQYRSKFIYLALKYLGFKTFDPKMHALLNI